MTAKPDSSRTNASQDAEGSGVVEGHTQALDAIGWFVHTPPTEEEQDLLNHIASAIHKAAAPETAAERDRWKAKVKSLTDANHRLAAERDTLKESTSQLQATIKAQLDEIVRLKEDKENFEILINTLDVEVTRLKASNKALREALEDLRASRAGEG
ncbi:MAG: hypothetical protein IH994_05985 [Proteobacteria bacterium]|nr:hypothetical protein [Pseudomonadota bacterium]